jgi:hypothetical protein
MPKPDHSCRLIIWTTPTLRFHAAIGSKSRETIYDASARAAAERARLGAAQADLNELKARKNTE